MSDFALISDPWTLTAETAIETGCGPGDTYCANSRNSSYMDTFRQDPCAVQTSAADNTRHSNYQMWVPEYKKEPAVNNAFHLTDTTSRFTPKKVLQESFLQGRGQVTGSRECFASGLKYMPEDIWSPESVPDTCSSKMSLFAQHTAQKRSCGTISETDMTNRLRPLPGIAQDPFVGPGFHKKGMVPNMVSKYGESKTLSTKSYPTFAELKRNQSNAMEE